jgi:hypothetical protein
VLSALDLALASAALLAGLAGTWSPCGFSAIDTLSIGGHGGRRSATLCAVLTFGLGAVAGGAATFVTLAWVGSLAERPGADAGVAVAIAIALAAAVLDVRGSRIVPQIRRQVPESWRRRMPLALAAGLYGVLLGLGFTTFVLTVAVWALAGIAVALGSIHAGLVIGLGFAAGRALPVMLIAPIADLSAGSALMDSMAQRPALLRGVRIADGLAMAVCAAALAGSPALAATPTVVTAGEDPSASGAYLAWQVPGFGGFLRGPAGTTALGCQDPALGGSLLACVVGPQISVVRVGTGAAVLQVQAAGADKVAVSDSWLVYRLPSAARGANETIVARTLSPLGPAVMIANVRPPDQLGRPALDGATVVFAAMHAGQRPSRIVRVDLLTGRRSVILSDPRRQLLNPSISHGRLLYERVGDCTSELLLARLRTPAAARVLAAAPTQIPRDGGYGPGAILEGRTPHHCVGPLAGSYKRVTSYWTTALGPGAAYMTLVSTVGASESVSLARYGL